MVFAMRKYAATYPVALVCVVLAAKLIVMLYWPFPAPRAFLLTERRPFCIQSRG